METVFLDRDGVLNEKLPEGQYVTRWEDFHLLPGVEEAIARLNRAGKRVLVVTNQRGIALGRLSHEAADALHARLAEHLRRHGARVDGFFLCPHERDACDCRKPQPGMFRQAMLRFPGIRADASVMIGDSLSDIEFGAQLGMPAILIEDTSSSHIEERRGAGRARALANVVCASLEAAVTQLLAAM